MDNSAEIYQRKRDRFELIKAAMQGLCEISFLHRKTSSEIAKQAIRQADAVLLELDKKVEK